jgi:uncharacterized protein YceK
MGKTRIQPLFAGLLIPFIFSGCGTLTARTKHDGGAYSGVSYDFCRLGDGREWSTLNDGGNYEGWPIPVPRAFWRLLDVPLSFTLDTLLLPADAVKALGHKTPAESPVSPANLPAGFDDDQAASSQPLDTKEESS